MKIQRVAWTGPSSNARDLNLLAPNTLGYRCISPAKINLFLEILGKRLRGAQDLQDIEGASNKLYADIAHPVNQACRDMIQHAVIREYRLELERAEQPGYVSRYDEEYVEIIPHTVSTPSIIPRPHMLKEPMQEPRQESLAIRPEPVASPSELGEDPARENPAGESTGDPSPESREEDFGSGIF